MGPSIEDQLEKALEKILQHSVILQAASRTDRGVHAEGQVVNFFTDKKDLDLKKLQKGINACLPDDIVVLKTIRKKKTFHPTLNSKGKEYHYLLCLGPEQLPKYRYTSWHIAKPLNIQAMMEAAKELIGMKDFCALTNRKKNETYENTLREVTNIKITKKRGGRLLIAIQGKDFLYKMVRNIVGLLVACGKGELQVGEVACILESKDRTKSALTAPARGLSLFRIFY